MSPSFQFQYTKQPQKSIHLLATYVKLVCMIPYWALQHIIPSCRTRQSWTIATTMVVKVMTVVLRLEGEVGVPRAYDRVQGMRSASKLKVGFADVKPLSEEFIVGDVKEIASLNGVEPIPVFGYWYGPTDSKGKVFLFIHGGAFIRGTAHPTDIAISGITAGITKYCPDSRVFAVEYRVAAAAPNKPSGAFPSALFDSLAGYFYLLDSGIPAKDIIVSGDSAGADIAISFLMYLSRYSDVLGEKLPLPRAAYLISPAVDWGQSHHGAGTSMEKNSGSDLIECYFDNDYCARAILGNLPLKYADSNEYISPASRNIPREKIMGVFSKFPETILVYGGAEILGDQIHTLRDRMVEDMGAEKVTDVEIEDAFHDFVAITMLPYTMEAMKKLRTWYLSL